ncbi:MAG: hypothetical protein NW223_05050 [Hyphomicrobiaceae bacterium]|nr:hypothetical protein [Hyphomicrobiaceae bacterium]
MMERLQRPLVVCAGRALAAAVAALLLAPSAALGLEELKHEKRVISACELNLCKMVVIKPAKGPDLKCDLIKTWGRSTIKQAESSTLSWGFGDARCTMKLHVKRAEIVNAVSASHAKFHLPDQKIDCIVEESADGRTATHVLIVVSPKIEMKDGKAEKIWVNLKSVEGPTAVAGTLKLAAFLADKLGLFHGAMLKGVNGFIHKGCPKVLAKAEAEAKEKKARPSRKRPATEAPAADAPAPPEAPSAAAAQKPAEEKAAADAPPAPKAPEPPHAEAPPAPTASD